MRYGFTKIGLSRVEEFSGKEELISWLLEKYWYQGFTFGPNSTMKEVVEQLPNHYIILPGKQMIEKYRRMV